MSEMWKPRLEMSLTVLLLRKADIMVETILQFEAEYNEKRGIPVDPKMLPKERREKFSEEEKPSLLETERLKFLSDANEEWRLLEQKLLSDKSHEASEKDHESKVQATADEDKPVLKAQKRGVS
ncbi:hypothetical protein ANCDUO_02502 [Ancylostoma duodenale]|uniref:Uncharacterized protein n=1 Tax=Ancylostoma duodenale TaxID=51022 RepID=A0A0C2H056_9BILA|nr:hypothetical protein ANCDUO_02502 [Ancylostoma duodenale]